MTLQPLLHESAISNAPTSYSGPAAGHGHAPQFVIVVSGELSIAGTSSAGPTDCGRHPTSTTPMRPCVDRTGT